MAELLLELFSEEIPARMQLPAAARLREEFEKKMQEKSVFFNHCKTFVTPRRLTLFADGLSFTQEDSIVEKRGPRTDAPEAALQGFLKSSGLTKEQLTVKSTGKGDFYFAIVNQKGRHTSELLKEILEDIITNFSWPKSMRWAAYDVRWVRPLKNIACVFGDEVLPISFGHLKANKLSFGHRFLSNGSFEIHNFNQYQKELESRFVILDTDYRKKIITENISAFVKDNGLNLIQDDELLTEVAGLVEYPVILLGQIDKQYMDVPDEVLITTIRKNQKYFCLTDKKGKIAPYFIVVSNIKSSDPSAIIAGNERVLRARLSDAKFFWNLDKNIPLENLVPSLEKVTFHAKLGTIHDKVLRIKEISKFIAEQIGADKTKVARAAELCKADLVSGMVGEFPELQGLMGYYYASHHNEDRDVAAAIRDHYRPLGPNDAITGNLVTACVAIADKIDSMAGLFAANEKPTGSKDPFALRRAALGVIRIILENKISLSINDLIEKSIKQISHAIKISDKSLLLSELKNFILERLRHQLKGEGFSDDLIRQVVVESEKFDIYDLKQKLIALDEFSKTATGEKTIAAFKRAANILAIEEGKEGKKYSPKPSEDLFEESPEIELFRASHAISKAVKEFVKNSEYKLALKELAVITASVNNFYDNTIINAKDKKIRENRLKLSALTVGLYEEFAVIG
jgi:glycyl-tRNA synthetase beta chain